MENNGNDYGEELKAIDVSGLYTNEGVVVESISAQSIDLEGLNEGIVSAQSIDLEGINEGITSTDDINLTAEVPYGVEDAVNYENMTVQELEQGLNLDDDVVNADISAFSEKAEINRKKKKIKKHFRKDDDLVSEIREEELPIIEMYRVYKSYQPGVDAVKNINFRIKKGEFVFIVGHSGSGKTTLMNLMMNAIRPSSGRVYVNGYELTRLHKRKIAKFRRGIGVVFQDFKLLNDRDIFENVAFAQRVIEKTTRQVNKNVPEVLSLVGLTHKQKALPTELSGGEQQRVAIARALVNQPTILLADEPTGNLDPKTAWEIMDLLEEINKRGTTVIVVTHNLEIVEVMKKRVIRLDKGNIVEDGLRGIEEMHDGQAFGEKVEERYDV